MEEGELEAEVEVAGYVDVDGEEDDVSTVDAAVVVDFVDRLKLSTTRVTVSS